MAYYMPEIEFIKGAGATLIPSTDSEREKMKAWKAGDVIKVLASKPRHGKHHRKGRVLLEEMFSNQSYFTDLEVYHHWVKLKIGAFTLGAAPDGTVFQVVKSTSYKDMDQVGFNRYYQDLITFAIQDGNLFEGKSLAEADAFVDRIIGGYA